MRIFNFQSTRQSEFYTLSVLRLSARHLSGLVARRLCLPYVVPAVSLYFYKVYSKQLGYFLALDYQPCPIWTVSRYALLGIPLVSFVRASCSRLTTQIPQTYQVLFLSFFIVRLSVGFVGVLIVPLLTVLYYSTKLSDGRPCDYKRCTRKYCPYLLLLSSHDEEGLMGFSFLLYDEFTLMSVYPHIM